MWNRWGELDTAAKQPQGELCKLMRQAITEEIDREIITKLKQSQSTPR
jgi:hypothetical protein